tara:strand:+ start:1761 stop:2258 length:498 start_codon:yes stop_codon:yes gene_type:complete
MNDKTIYIICGYARVGKDTFAQHLADALDTKMGTTSDIIYETMSVRRGVSVDELKAIWKEDLRDDLVEMGDALCNIAPDYLAQALINRGVRVISGVRRLSEAQAIREPKKIIWMERRHFTSPPDNTELSLSLLADTILQFGEGDLEGMKIAAQQIADNELDGMHV